ncbi:MAG: SWIM zinc finger family protein [Deltaproteobacteria bacterium]|nr:SWIM zinc finger family protein [Deltaproteobacteria bacterium]
MSTTLKTEITHLKLRRLAGEKFYGRGVSYFENGHVEKLTTRKNSISGSVAGSYTYRTKIWLDERENGLDYSCSCPVGQDGYFCKHLVATGLEWIEKQADSDTGEKEPLSAAKAWMQGLEKDHLIRIILDHADVDDDFFNWLVLQASILREGKDIDVKQIKNILKGAISIRGFVNYHDAYDYYLGVEQAVDSLGQLLENGHAEHVIELAEYALSRLETAMHNVDDSDGYLHGIISDLLEFHLKACGIARPDPISLARRLFSWEVESDWDFFTDAAETYADVLGREGLDMYRKLLEKAWEEIPPLGPEDTESRYDHRRHMISSRMTAIALRREDRDMLLEIKKRDLSSPDTYLEIAKIHLDAGEIDDAVSWAEKAASTFPHHYMKNTIIDFLAELYIKTSKPDSAIEIIWKSFKSNPCMERYTALKNITRERSKWPLWKGKAFELVKEHIQEDKSKKNTLYRFRKPDNSLLVEMHLHEKDIESAWLAARSGGCHVDLWRKLARLRETDHPADSLEVYQLEIDRILKQTNMDAYREAVRTLGKIRKLMIPIKGEKSFETYLDIVRSSHKRKRNFIGLVDKKKWD